MSTSLSTILAAEGLSVGSGGGVGIPTGANTFNIKADLEAATIDTSLVKAVRTLGWGSIGDKGGGLYRWVATQPTHKGRIQSGDGAWWELMPSEGEIWVEQFGAVGDKVNFNSKAHDCAPGVNDAIEYMNFGPDTQLGLGQSVSAKLRIGGGMFYFASTPILKGNFHFEGTATWAQGNGGQSTMIRPDINVDGLFGASPSCINRLTSAYSTVFPYTPGQQMYTATRMYRCSSIVGGSTVYDAYNRIYIQQGMATGPAPTGTGAGIIDGQVRWDYVRDTTRVERINNGFMGKVSSIAMFSFWNPAQNPVTKDYIDAAQPFNTACGIIGTYRMWVEDCWIGEFSQHCVAFVNNGDPTLPYCTGNTDANKLVSTSLYYAGCDGFHTGDQNANACYFEHLDIAFSGRWAVAEWSFLGNEYSQLQEAADGWIQLVRWNKAHACTHNGYKWIARAHVKGGGDWPNWDTVEPGTDDSVWQLYFGSGSEVPTASGFTWPAWGGATSFEPGGGYNGLNQNAHTLWASAYIEGGENFTQYGPNDIIIGGFQQQVIAPVRGTIIADGKWTGQFTSTYGFTKGAPLNNFWNFNVSIGGMDNDGGQGPQAMQVLTADFNFFKWIARANDGGAGNAHFDLVGRFDLGSGNDRFFMTLAGTHRLCGRATNYIDPGSWQFKSLFVGSQGEIYSRRIDMVDGFGSIAGRGTETAHGDINFNISGNVGEPAGFYTVAGGSSGTFGTNVPIMPIGGVKRSPITSGPYTLLLTDGFNTVVETDNIVTIPPNSSVAFLIGTEIEIVSNTGGAAGVAAGSGVTLRVPTGLSATLAQWQKVKIRQRATNDWVLSN